VALAVSDATPTSGTDKIMDLLFMADIGHSRDHRVSQYTEPASIMKRSAFEGAFSLFDGLQDFIVNQGIRPEAVLIAGDVGYVGGASNGLNETEYDFQKYLQGVVPKDKVFPLIGNHDVNYLGCMVPSPSGGGVCWYGAGHTAVVSSQDLNFHDWRQNWFTHFPGLDSAIIPESLEGHDWMAPGRYNLNLKEDSSVYFIMGLVSGAFVTSWPGTPVDSTDGSRSSQKDLRGDSTECAFLRDSIKNGRKMGKTVFVYMTHHFNQNPCSDWSLISQIDVWIYGHVHNAWQNVDQGSIVKKEDRNYPVRVLIGNGGFDNGLIDTVSFGRLTEEVVPSSDSSSEERVRLNFEFYDTCISTKWRCPVVGVNVPGCWQKCRDVPGGHDSGGGPRKALPTKQKLGFSIEAPRRPPKSKPHPSTPFESGAWNMKVLNGTNGTSSSWMTLSICRTAWVTASYCLTISDSEDDAAAFHFYDQSLESAGPLKNYSARVAVAGDGRGPLQVYDGFLYEGPNFWDTSLNGPGSMNADDGLRLQFQQKDNDTWTIVHVQYINGSFQVLTDASQEVSFQRARPKQVPVFV